MPRSAGRRGFERRPARREVGRKVIIVCEGSKTEKGYFNAIRASLRLPTVQIAVYHPDATNPRRIVEYARQKRQEQIDNGGWNPAGEGDCAWAVYDGVEHYQHNKRDWDEALDLAQSNGIHLAITNPSFELWYLLHFQEQTAMLHRDAACIRLKENWIKDYEKGQVLYPDPLKERTRDAIERARKLAKQAKVNNQKPHECLCAEGVAELVALLLNLACSR